MKVKVGNKVYDGNIEPIMVILEDQDKINIGNMPKECHNYCQYPDGILTDEELDKFMDE